jgi:leader peptidase (prepilin peptidase)/N-methyltransferase
MPCSLMPFYVFVIGSCIGSFLNVCIYRLPKDLSIVSPPSFCPQCRTPVRGYDNIPLLSYLLLRGKCRSCGAKISGRYPLVEALTGTFAVALFLKFGLSVSFFASFAFTAALIVITFIDLDHRIIPDVISLPGIAAGFGLTFLLPTPSWTESLIGLVVGGGSLYLVAIGYEALTKREGMSGRDVKLLTMIKT